MRVCLKTETTFVAKSDANKYIRAADLDQSQHKATDG